MPAAFSDSHPTLYVVHGRAKPVLCGPNSTDLACPIMEKPHSGLDDCLRMLQVCLRRKMSERRAEEEALRGHRRRRGGGQTRHYKCEWIPCRVIRGRGYYLQGVPIACALGLG